jgi:hypothetical protein
VTHLSIAATTVAPTRTRSPSAPGYFLLGSAFAVLDAVSTWYAMRFTGLIEGNRALLWAFDQMGLGPTLVLRVLLGCVALALLAWGVSAQFPTQERLFNFGCRVLLVTCIVIWGIAAISNITQIVALRLHFA